jgi:hypothetical protein
MKYKGKVVKGKNQEIIPIPRKDGDIIFIAEAIQDWTEFEKFLAPPKPPVIFKPGGIKIEKDKDKKYLEALDEFNEQRTNYLIVASLQATPELEWETVQIDNPSTWKNIRKELTAADFTDLEIGRIWQGVMKANSLDENMIDEARDRFLLGQQGGTS